MKLIKSWIGYVCVATILLFVIIGISIMFIRMENYVLLGNMGTMRFKRTIKPTEEMSDKSTSLKYQGHRYDRHHIRTNPHVRRYQD